MSEYPVIGSARRYSMLLCYDRSAHHRTQAAPRAVGTRWGVQAINHAGQRQTYGNSQADH